MSSTIKRTGALIVILLMALSVFAIFSETESYAASIKLSKKSVVIAKGSSVKLKVKGTKAKVKWSSEDKSIATVTKKGVVKGKNYGKTTIIAKVKGKTLKCTVKVEKKYQIKARQLRSYILKHGKKGNWEYIVDDDGKYKLGYAIGYQVDGDFSSEKRGRVVAYKDTTELSFMYHFVYDNEFGHCHMYIDLIKDKPGTFDYFYTAENTEYDEIAEGTVKIDYDGTASTLMFDKGSELQFDVAKELNRSFNMYNKIFRIKKISPRMKNLGFTKWVSQ